MKKILLITLLMLVLQFQAFPIEEYTNTYSQDGKFGLIKNEQKITEAKYNKLIRLGDTSWLCMYKNKYGIISNNGEILVPIKYSQAQRFVGKYVKLGSKGKYALFDEFGQTIIGQEYSSIDILYGRMFLVEKNYKYGLISFDGDFILAPVADDIYMPKPNILKILFDGVWYEIKQEERETIKLPTDISNIDNINKDYTIKQFIQKPITSAGYGVVSISDYFLKIFSSISPSYEETIDELILNHGADTATILMKSSWLLKFPFVYSKNYINNIKAPNNGPCADLKSNLKNKINKR